ncbi:MAG: alpha/beta hydrolase-fold protein [Gemmataceae bacterium]
MSRISRIVSFTLTLTLFLDVPIPARSQSPRQTGGVELRIVEPDRNVMATIREKVAELNAALLPLEDDEHFADVAIYAKAVDYMIRHGEWYGPKAGEQTLLVLDAGLKRARELAEGPGTPSWLKVRGRPIIRGYFSVVDGSVQPYSMIIPEGYDPSSKTNRLDVILAGRDATKTEVKFIAVREASTKTFKVDHLVVEPYGRGNNAYRWAGETDVFEVKNDVASEFPFDINRIVLRGFSMGGAGAWHLGLHHPKLFAAVSPGAGFTVTRGYVKGLPAELPDYVDRCLHIYDAADYAENVSIVPIIAYSGERDPQIAAARNIEERLLAYPEIRPFVHFVAPGLEHRQPADWLAKIEVEVEKNLPRKTLQNERFVTYTPKYGDAGWIQVAALERQYEKAEVTGKIRGGNPTITTKNVRLIGFRPINGETIRLTIDGQLFDWPGTENNPAGYAIVKREQGTWRQIDEKPLFDSFLTNPIKRKNLQGPIDDAFMDRFYVVKPGGVPMHREMAVFASSRLKQFREEWERWMRGRLPTSGDEQNANLVLFGDPGCNGMIAAMLPKLPIVWTETKLMVNGVEYDPHTHVPVLIYPNPNNPNRYVVINSGHTFHENDFQGTNALLYPRLGDWAVLKPRPTKEDPTAADVVAAGFFDENWQFPKK